MAISGMNPRSLFVLFSFLLLSCGPPAAPRPSETASLLPASPSAQPSPTPTASPSALQTAEPTARPSLAPSLPPTATSEPVAIHSPQPMTPNAVFMYGCWRRSDQPDARVNRLCFSEGLKYRSFGPITPDESGLDDLSNEQLPQYEVKSAASSVSKPRLSFYLKNSRKKLCADIYEFSGNGDASGVATRLVFAGFVTKDPESACTNVEHKSLETWERVPGF